MTAPDARALEAGLGKLRGVLLARKPDFATACGLLPPPCDGALRSTRVELARNERRVIAGDLIVDRLELADGAMLWILGDCSVTGDIVADLGYSALVVRGTLTAETIRTSGELFALAGITAEMVWGIGNDHSTFAPSLKCGLYVAEDRGDFIPIKRCEARFGTGGRDLNELYELRPDLFPDEED